MFAVGLCFLTFTGYRAMVEAMGEVYASLIVGLAPYFRRRPHCPAHRPGSRGADRIRPRVRLRLGAGLLGGLEGSQAFGELAGSRAVRRRDRRGGDRLVEMAGDAMPGPPASRNSGSSLRRRSWAKGQRVWKRQPVGGATGWARRLPAACASAPPRIGPRDRREQRLGVGVQGPA